MSWAFAGGVWILLAATGANGQCQYDVTVIQAPPCPPPFNDPPATTGTGINELGHVVGYYLACGFGPHQAFVWRPESGLITLEVPTGFSGAEAWDINGLGHIVGRIGLAAIDRDRAALWQDGKAFNLGTLPGGNYSEAFAVNSSGQVVGSWGHNFMEPGFPNAFLWQDGLMVGLELPMGPHSVAADVNERGQVVGWMGTSFLTNGRAFIWEQGVVTGLGPIPGGFTSRARAINSNGVVVGFGQIPADGFTFGLARAFVFDGARMTVLEPLPGRLRSAATDVNDAAQVVGACTGSLDNPNASDGFIWRNGVMTNLNDMIPAGAGVHINSAWGTNNAGQITGQASTASGVVAVLLTPVKPPGDLDGDCRVRVPDLLTLLAAWGRCPPACPADLNDDGTVNQLDLVLLIENWG